MGTVGGQAKPAPPLRVQDGRSHQAAYAFLADPQPFGPEGAVQARPPVRPAARGMQDTKTAGEADIVVGPRTERPPAGGVVATATHLQRTAQHLHRDGGLLCLNEGKPYSLCLAKKAVAFFRMSRSIRNSRFSRRSGRSSVRSSSVSGTSGFGRVAVTHRPKVPMVTPRSRAIFDKES